MLAHPMLPNLDHRLNTWEYSEYIAASVVTLACVGEYLADFTSWWSEKCRHKLAKASTLLLIAALAVELTCLVKTNALSAELFGSLAQKAGEAGRQATQASTQASAAQLEATAAAVASHDAELSSQTATAQSAQAANFAANARQEADSFARDIVSAKQQAADAESHLAEALQRAAEAQAELNKLKMPRSLNNAAELTAQLSRYKGTTYRFSSAYGDAESFDFLAQLMHALDQAGWKRMRQERINLGIPARQITTKNDLVDTNFKTGLRIEVQYAEAYEKLDALSREQQPSYIAIAESLNRILLAHIAPGQGTESENPVEVDTGSSMVISIRVGKKP